MNSSELGQEENLKERIYIKGARANNLKNIDLSIPKNQLVVVTGVSGSGKSSITMETLYAEGQRRYVESLSSYARQFLGRMKKPDVDYIKGICPAIAIEQKVSTSNARSTVGTLTEIYDFLRLLYARIGKTYSPVSGEIVKRHEVSDVVNFIQAQAEGAKIQLLIPLQKQYPDRTLQQELTLLLQKGYNRADYQGVRYEIEALLENNVLDLTQKLKDFDVHDVQILIDRFVVASNDVENVKRIADSVQTAFFESAGECLIDVMEVEQKWFNNRFELDGISFLENTPQLFNYNNPYGACPKCEGFGRVMGIEEDKVIPNQFLSIKEGAVACWSGEKSSTWQEQVLQYASKVNLPIHRPYRDLTKAERKMLWEGTAYFSGINAFFQELETNLYKIQNRVMLARYRGKTTCPICDGTRLRPEAQYVKINQRAVTDLVDLPIDELANFFEHLEWSEYDQKVGKRLLLEIQNRLLFMMDLGLGYLTLNRLSSTLSGGETQRINLTRTLGSNLTASMYILDEPSVGLHPRDTARLVKVLRKLRDLGNTVVVVEHEEDIIASADYLIDIGPKAGIHGGEVIFAGPYSSIHQEATESLTTKYMSGRMEIVVPKRRRKFTNSIWIRNASMHNLKDVDVQFPLNTLTVVSGVSGSGKTTLVKQILYPALKQHFGESSSLSSNNYRVLEGDLKQITLVEMISQSPIGKSSRSNPITYVKAYDSIRSLMANQQLSKIRGYEPKHFSFNVDGGRCDTCKGEGEQIIEMQFLADISLECEECKGKRFKQEVLEVRYKEKNISEILDLSIDEALEFFAGAKDIVSKILPLQDVGLGYVKLGQSSSTLSGGEAQRVKLASFLGKEKTSEKIFFIFDEPTTGLHFYDVNILLIALNALVEKGHTVLVVEHNLDVIKCADWLIDLGPEGGKNGGHLVYQGLPEGILSVKDSFTGQFLAEKLRSVTVAG